MPFHVDLSERELKLIVAALRQVRHTFAVAQRQEEKLAAEYGAVEQAYEDLHLKLARLLNAAAGPQRVK